MQISFNSLYFNPAGVDTTEYLWYDRRISLIIVAITKIIVALVNFIVALVKTVVAISFPLFYCIVQFCRIF